MTDSIVNNIDELDSQYNIIIKDSNDIINEMNLSDDDSLITKSIVEGMEKAIADALVDGKTVSIPYIGRVRKNPVKKHLKEHYEELREARSHMSYEEYRQFCGNIVNDIKSKIAYEDFIKFNLARIKSANKAKYNKLYIALGEAYANVYIKSIFWLKYVPFDRDVQEAFDNLKD